MNKLDRMDGIESFPIAKRYLRRLMLLRYQRLLKDIEDKFPITSDQKTLLQKCILNVQWVDGVFQLEN